MQPGVRGLSAPAHDLFPPVRAGKRGMRRGVAPPHHPTAYVLTILDVTSRLKVESYPCIGTTKPALPDYQLALRRAFWTYGLPQRLTLDRDTVFFDSTTPSPFPTRLHLWLVALGIAVCFDPHQGVFIGRPEGSDRVLELVPHGLTKADLMGELAGPIALPAYQFALPFSQTAWRELEYARGLTSTTLRNATQDYRA